MITSGSGSRAAIIFDATDNTGAAFASLQARLASAKVKINDVGTTAAALPARFGTIGAALGAAFAGASLKGAIDMGDQLDDLSEKTGIAVKDLSELRYAGEVTGTPIEALATGVKKLSTTMYEAAGGGKEQAAIFKALGIEVKTASGALRGSDEVLGDIADAFAGFNDGPEKAALAVKIFGKAGADMIPLLNQGSAGIKELRQEAKQLGATIGDDAARNFAAFNDNLKKLELYSEGAKNTIANELVPTLNTIAEAFLQSRDGGNAFADFIGGTLRTGLEALTVVGANVAFVLKGVGRELAAWAAQAVALARLDIDGFNAISEAVKEDGVRARAELDALELRILNTGKSLAGAGRGIAADPRVLGSVGTIREQSRFLRSNAPVVGSPGAGAEKETISDYEREATAISNRIGLLNEEVAVGRELTEQEKRRYQVLTKLRDSKKEVTQAELAAIEAMLKAEAAQELDVAQKRAILAQEKQISAERQKLRNADNDSVGAWLREQEAQASARLASINERTQSITDEIEATELAATANISLAEAVELVAIARLREKQERLNQGSPAWEDVEREIAAREQLLATIGKQRVAKDLRDNFTKLADDIYSGLTDSLFRAFEAGGNFFSTFWNGIKNTIKTTVLRIAIQAVLGTGGTTGIIGQVLGAGNVGAGSVGSGLGGLGSLLGLGGTLGTFSGGLAAGFGGLTGSIGSLFGVAGTGATLGGSISAGFTALGAGNIAGGLGTLAGALGPIVAGIALVAQLAKSFKGETRSGGQYNLGNFISGPSGGEIGGSGVASEMAKITAASINATLAKVGSSAVLTNLFTGLESSKNGKGFAYAGGTLSTGGVFGEGWGAAFPMDPATNRRGNLTDAEAMAAYEEELMQATLQAFQSITDGPKAIAQELAGKDFNTMAKTELEAQLAVINQLITDVDKFNAAAQTLPFERLTGLSFDLASGLIKAAGGMDTLLAGMQAFYSADFFSESELRQQTARNIQRTLAAAGGTFTVADILSAADKGEIGRAMWREVVTSFEEQVAAGNEAATPLLAALYSVSGAFASITPIIEEVAGTVGDSIDALAQQQADYRNSLASAGGTIAGLIRELTVSRAGTASPTDRLAAARAQYLADLGGARSGSVEASQRVADSAQAYIDAQVGYSASGPQTQATINQVLAELQALPAFATYEQQLLEQATLQAELLGAIKVNTAATVSAVSAGFTGLGGYVPGTVGSGTTPTGGAAFGGSAAQQQTVGQGLASGGAAFGGTATVGAGIQAMLGMLDWANPTQATATLAQEMRANGWTAGDVSEVYDWFTPQQIADHLKAAGFADVVPGYRVGANRIPNTQLAMLHADEAVIPAPFNPWAGGVGLAADNTEVVNELRAVRQELQQSRAEVTSLRDEMQRQNVLIISGEQNRRGQGEKLIENTAASKNAVLLAANQPTPVKRKGGA